MRLVCVHLSSLTHTALPCLCIFAGIRLSRAARCSKQAWGHSPRALHSVPERSTSLCGKCVVVAVVGVWG